jgi:transcriptional regulator with XRE-family HTH domain
MTHPLTLFRQQSLPHMTQTALGRLLGLSRSHISRIESGERQLSPDLLPLVCRRTGIAPEILRPDLASAMRRAHQGGLLTE